ncbi:galactokinase [Staphylococcus condimenti]|uniref:Galactokinase n=3 Tax=Staphylococcus condimenti TaxID=70255 RepID=A0AB37GZP4_9STAP|nr:MULTISPECIES: galactokinase [Staphylococcus]AMY06478.1 galactokinase [Staphylococcus condimenti]APR60361.1 galactokinase [Staphylococcus condimenti]MDK8646378.1 galactokinase [Staphylococcus condimenti]OFP00731.1 galactokinase [Staphylococcus sp. HMSC065E08]PNZ58214.1 galactokinase [Staphylococcus condimenti]
MLTSMKSKFDTLFNTQPEVAAFTPGRINLIGEHTDYNGGYVFPAAIELGTYGLASKRNDRKICLYSNNFESTGTIEFSLDELQFDAAHSWANYPKGMVKYLKELDYKIDTGFNILIEGNIPNGASLSSSASIEILMGWLLKSLFNLEVDRLELIHLGRKVENHFIGVNSGIMDQFIVGMGRKDQAILLDTATLDYHYVPTEFGDYVISIMNTNKRRELAESKYNERLEECQKALALLQHELEVDALGHIDAATFEKYAYLIKDNVLLRRARHAITENARVKKAYDALNRKDFIEFGKLLNASHASLKEDYEVTGIELDTLAETAQQVEGVLGARMTGAGFAGCAIALVHKDRIKNLEQEVTENYTKKIGYEPSFYHVNIGDGVKSLDIKEG